MWYGLTLVEAVILGELTLWIWRITPAQWLCDYGQIPGEAESKRRGMSRKTELIFFASAIGYLVFTGFLFGAGADSWRLLYAFVLFIPLSQIAAADIRFCIVPDQWLCLLALLCAFAAWKDGSLGLNFRQSWWISALFWAAAVAAAAVNGSALLGIGDVKLLSVIGLAGGASVLWTSLLMASLFCGSYCAAGLLAGRMKKKDSCPLAPFLIAAWGWASVYGGG